MFTVRTNGNVLSCSRRTIIQLRETYYKPRLKNSVTFLISVPLEVYFAVLC